MRLSSRLRELLRSKRYSAGATVSALGILVQRDPTYVRVVLCGMPDAYIAEWVPARGGAGGRFAQVWRVVVPPPHCPPPPKGRTK